MKKNEIVAKILKVFAIIIILIGVYVFFDLKLWKKHAYEFHYYFQTFLPILVLGFSGTLYGIATLLENKRK